MWRSCCGGEEAVHSVEEWAGAGGGGGDAAAAAVENGSLALAELLSAEAMSQSFPALQRSQIWEGNGGCRAE